MATFFFFILRSGAAYGAYAEERNFHKSSEHNRKTGNYIFSMCGHAFLWPIALFVPEQRP
jgi:hypothetical protein